MIKSIIFDLDGVLIDLKEAHYDCLNSALKRIDLKYVISLDEHYKIYDGLPTKDKLKILTKQKGLDEMYYNDMVGDWDFRRAFDEDPEFARYQDPQERQRMFFSYLKFLFYQ